MKYPGVTQLARTFLECLERDIATGKQVTPPAKTDDDAARESEARYTTPVFETSPALVTVRW